MSPTPRHLHGREPAGRLSCRQARTRRPRRVRAAFVFTGAGCEHPRMTAGLHRGCVAYREHLATADAALLPYLGTSVERLMLEGDPRISQTAFSQPALFAAEYALAMTLFDAEVRPVALLGHGAGEIAAATAAGALSLSRAAQLVTALSILTHDLPIGGGMLATCVNAYEAADVAADEPGVFIGAINAARATVLSGELSGLGRVEDHLREAGFTSRYLPTSHALHSPLLAPMTAEFETAARRLPSGPPPGVPYYSTVYGRTFQQPLDAGYWARQLTTPVRFADAGRALLREQAPSHVVEIGPRQVLTPFLRRMAGKWGPECLATCHGPSSTIVDLAGVLSALNAGPLAADP